MDEYFEKMDVQPEEALRAMTEEELVAEAGRAIRAYDKSLGWYRGANDAEALLKLGKTEELREARHKAYDAADRAARYHAEIRHIFDEKQAFPLLDKSLPDPEAPQLEDFAVSLDGHPLDSPED